MVKWPWNNFFKPICHSSHVFNFNSYFSLLNFRIYWKEIDHDVPFWRFLWFCLGKLCENELHYKAGPAKGGEFQNFVFRKIQNMASFDSFECIKIIMLKLNFYDYETLILTRILEQYQITITKRRSLVITLNCNLKTFRCT